MRGEADNAGSGRHLELWESQKGVAQLTSPLPLAPCSCLCAAGTLGFRPLFDDGVNVVCGEGDGGAGAQGGQARAGRAAGQLAPEGLPANLGDADLERLARERPRAGQERQLDGVADLKAANLFLEFLILNALAAAHFGDVFNLYRLAHDCCLPADPFALELDT